MNKPILRPVKIYKNKKIDKSIYRLLHQASEYNSNEANKFQIAFL